MRCNLNVVLVAIVFVVCLPMIAVADPIDGRDTLKFQQVPMINTTIPGPEGPVVYHGHDELSTAWGVPDVTGNFPLNFQGTFMADDFADRFDLPVVHVKWWGSYLKRPTGIPDARVRRFLISFEEDVPAPAAGGFSRPGTPLLNQIVSLDTDGVFDKGEGTFTEKIVGDISVDGPIFEYNAELHLGKSFHQKPNTVYWLKIVALDEIPNANIPLDQRLQWGWHNRDYTVRDPLASTPADGVIPGEHPEGPLPVPGGVIPIWHFQDDAVSGAIGIQIIPTMPTMPMIVQTGFEPQRYRPLDDGPSVIGQFSKDLAFELYTIPEPSTMILGILAMAGVQIVARRRRR